MAFSISTFKRTRRPGIEVGFAIKNAFEEEPQDVPLDIMNTASLLFLVGPIHAGPNVSMAQM